jgi:CBS domain-containing protein
MRAADIMTRQVITIRHDASVWEAVRLMLQNKISGLPVVDQNGQLVGMATEGDFLRRAETKTERTRPRWLEFLTSPGALAKEYTHSHARRVEEVMTSEPLTVSGDAPLDQVVHVLEKHHIKRVPVLDGERLIGIISRANLLHALAAVAADLPPPAKDDVEIRERLLAELAGKPWSPKMVNVVVRSGVVELSGVIFDDRTREAIKTAAENVRGVKAVHDHIVWVEPMSAMVFYSGEDQAERAASGG